MGQKKGNIHQKMFTVEYFKYKYHLANFKDQLSFIRWFILASKSSLKNNFEWDGLKLFFSFLILFRFLLFIVKNKLKVLHLKLEFQVYFYLQINFHIVNIFPCLFIIIYYKNGNFNSWLNLNKRHLTTSWYISIITKLE